MSTPDARGEALAVLAAYEAMWGPTFLSNVRAWFADRLVLALDAAAASGDATGYARGIADAVRTGEEADYLPLLRKTINYDAMDRYRQSSLEACCDAAVVAATQAIRALHPDPEPAMTSLRERAQALLSVLLTLPHDDPRTEEARLSAIEAFGRGCVERPCGGELHVYDNGNDKIIARSPEDATALRLDAAYGLSPWNVEEDGELTWRLVPDDREIDVGGGGYTGRLRADMWVRAQGRGVLCSTEWA